MNQDHQLPDNPSKRKDDGTIGESDMIVSRWVLAVVLGVGVLLGPVSAASASPCRCSVADTRVVAVPVDPPFTLPYERPDGPVGAGIAWVLDLVPATR